MSALNRIKAMAHKEYLHILHDPRSLVIVILLPILQLIMFGYALNMEIQNVRLAVYDFDGTRESEDLVKAFSGSKFFTVLPQSGDPSALDGMFMRGEVRAALLIRQGFGAENTPEAPLQLVVDASDPNAATLIRNYVSETVQSFALAKRTSLPLDVRSTMLYNPGLVSSVFFVPGLIALILIMISALLTSITVTRERETGTMEQLLVSPLRPLEFIVGKLLPYVVLSMLIGIVILVLSMILFHVQFAGSPWLLFGMSLIYVLVALSLGLMISTVASNQLTAMMAALMTTLLPSMMLSGFVFAIASMPKLLQYLTYIVVPARYYLRIARGILLKGNGLNVLWPEALVLSGFCLVLLSVAWMRFRREVR